MKIGSIHAFTRWSFTLVFSCMKRLIVDKATLTFDLISFSCVPYPWLLYSPKVFAHPEYSTTLLFILTGEVCSMATGTFENSEVFVFIFYFISKLFMRLTSLSILFTKIFLELPGCVIIGVISSAYIIFKHPVCGWGI